MLGKGSVLVSVKSDLTIFRKHLPLQLGIPLIQATKKTIKGLRRVNYDRRREKEGERSFKQGS